MVPISNQVETINQARLNDIVLVAKRTIDVLLQQVDEGTLSCIKDKETLENFQKNIDDIIVAKLRKKFSV